MVGKDNQLQEGQSRVGWMVDGLPETPLISLMLSRTHSEVGVTIPFSDERSDPYHYWFSSNMMYADDPARSKRRYEAPNAITFFSADGSVGLVGSRESSSKRSWVGPGSGEGRLIFDFTVLGASSGSAFESVNGLRSEVEGLGTWIGLRALDARQALNEAGRLDSVTLQLKSSEPIPVARKLNAAFQSNWRYGPGPGPDETTISERMQIHTQVRQGVTWDEHLAIHFPLRDLLRMAAWRRLDFVSHEAMSHADPLRTLDGVSHGDQWLPVITYRTGISAKPPAKMNSLEFLFSFGDIGSVGVGRWLQLNQKFERGLQPLLRLLDLQGATLEAHVAQAGMGFELLGYEMLRAHGMSKRQADAKSWEERTRAISSAAAEVLPFSEDDFVARFRKTYMAVKHADRALPDLEVMHLAYREAIQVFRAWTALRLGVPKKVLRATLKRDKVTRHIEAIQQSLPAVAP
jgi:hypothetical protein